jgi:hypothetical protein
MGIPSPAVLVLPGRGSTGLQPFRYHALRGNPSGEEVRDVTRTVIIVVVVIVVVLLLLRLL